MRRRPDGRAVPDSVAVQATCRTAVRDAVREPPGAARHGRADRRRHAADLGRAGRAGRRRAARRPGRPRQAGAGRPGRARAGQHHRLRRRLLRRCCGPGWSRCRSTPATPPTSCGYVLADSGRGRRRAVSPAAPEPTCGGRRPRCRTAGAGARSTDLPTVAATLAVLLYTSGTSGRPKGAMLTPPGAGRQPRQLDRIEPAGGRPGRRRAARGAVLPRLRAEHRARRGRPPRRDRGAGRPVRPGGDARAHRPAPGHRRRRRAVDVSPPGRGCPRLGEAMAAVRIAVCGAAPLDPADAARFTADDRHDRLHRVRADRDRAGAHHHRGQRPGEDRLDRPAAARRRAAAARPPTARCCGRTARRRPPTTWPSSTCRSRTRPAPTRARSWCAAPTCSPATGRTGATARTPTAGGRTGDIAYADADGDLFLVDRIGELILVNGFNVYPAEVERVLDAHPGGGRGGGDRRAAPGHRADRRRPTWCPRSTRRRPPTELLRLLRRRNWPGSSCRPRSSSSPSCRTRRSARCARRAAAMHERRHDPADPDQPGRLPPCEVAEQALDRIAAGRRAVDRGRRDSTRSSWSATTATGCRWCCSTARSTATGGSRRTGCCGIWR